MDKDKVKKLIEEIRESEEIIEIRRKKGESTNAFKLDIEDNLDELEKELDLDEY